MYKYKRKAVSIIVSAALLFTSGLSPAIYSNAEALKNPDSIALNTGKGGSYGENITYYYWNDNSSAKKKLILEGSGAAESLSEQDVVSLAAQKEKQPWLAYGASADVDLTNVKEVQCGDILIDKKITELGENMFRRHLGTIYLGPNIKKIPSGCFVNLPASTLIIYGELEEVAQGAFENMSSLALVLVTSETTRQKLEAAGCDSSLILTPEDMGASSNELVDDISLRIAVAKGQIEMKIHEPNATYDGMYTSVSWQNLKTAVNKYKDHLEDGDGDFLPDNPANAEQVEQGTQEINTALENLVSLEVLNDAIDQASALTELEYTPESWAVLSKALEDGKAAKDKDTITQEEIAQLAKAITDAIDNLKKPGVDAALEAMNNLLSKVEELVETDYTASSWSTLQAAVAQAEALSGDESAQDITAISTAISDAIEGLVVEYQDLPPLGKIPFTFMSEAAEVILSGTADATLNGAVKIVFTIDTDPAVSYNSMCEFYYPYKIGSKSGELSYSLAGDKQATWNAGGKGYTQEITIPEIKEGDTYSISAYTKSWESLEYPFIIQKAEFKNNQDEVIKTVRPLPTNDLKEALENAEKLLENTVDYSEDTVKALQDAVDAAKQLLEEDTPLPSKITSLTSNLQTASEGLAPADTAAAKQALAEKVTEAEGLKKEDYTEDSWAALQKALEAAKNPAEDAKNSDLAALQKAVEDAIAALKPAETASSPTPGTNPTGTPGATESQSPAPTPPAPTESSTPSAVVSPTPIAPSPSAPATVTKPGKVVVKKITAKKATLSIKIKKKIKGAAGYQVTVSAKKNFKKAKKVTVTKVKKLTITTKYKKLKLKKGKKYYLKVRAYKKNNGKKVYGSYSKAKRFTAK